MTDVSIKIRVLGPLEVVAGNTLIPIGGPTQRAVLAALVVAEGQVVTADQLIDAVWGPDAPTTAEHALQSHVARFRSQLRKASATQELIRSVAGGYMLGISSDHIDATRFTTAIQAADEALAAGDLGSAIERVRAALALWRGRPYADVRESSTLRLAARHLEEARLHAWEVCAEASLRLGKGADLVPDLLELTEYNPFRERFWTQLIHALYQAGRQSDALEAYRRAARLLRDELGMSPGRDLQEMEQRVLRHDPILAGAAQPSGVTPASVPSPALPRALAVSGVPWTGRKAEMERLRQAWKRTAHRDPQIVLLSGEAGIGKTRLAAEMAIEAHRDGAVVLYGACSEDLDVPYEPLVAALRGMTRSYEEDGNLRGLLGRYPADLALLAPELKDLLRDLPEPLRTEADAQRQRLWLAVVSWLEAVADGTGAMFVLDDLQWADGATLSLLRHLARDPPSFPLLLCVTVRDDHLDPRSDVSGVIADLRRSNNVVHIGLAGLEVDDVVELSRAGWRGTRLDERAEEIAPVVWGETEGNAFFVVEVLRHFAETWTPEHDSTSHANWASRHLPIPRSVFDVVRDRVARLPEVTEDVLQVAAVIGIDFSSHVVSGAIDHGSETVLDALDEATKANILRETGQGTYRFSHALVRAALYEDLAATKRARVHLRIARMLESMNADPADLVYHYLRATGIDGDALSKAIDHALTVGQRALSQAASKEAEATFLETLSLLDAAKEQATRRRVEVLIGLGTAQRDSGNAAYRETLLDAARVAGDLDLPELLAEAALANHRGVWSAIGETDTERVRVLRRAINVLPPDARALRSRLLARLAVETTFSAHHEEIGDLIGEAESIGRSLSDPTVLVESLAARVTSGWNPGTAAALHESAAEMVVTAEGLADPVWASLAHAFLGLHLRTAGRRERAREETELAEAIAEGIAHAPMLLLTTAFLAAQAIYEGDVREAERLAMKTLERGQETGQPDAFAWFMGQTLAIRILQGRVPELLNGAIAAAAPLPELPLAQASLGVVLVDSGKSDEAAAILRWLVDGLDDLRFDWTWLQTLYYAAHIARGVGHAAPANQLYAALLPYAGQVVNGGAVTLGSVDHALGASAAAAGRNEDAERHFADAAAFEEMAEMRGWAMLSQFEWARLLLESRRDRDLSKACSLLEHVQMTAADMGNEKLISRTRQLLRSRDDLEG